MLCKLSFSNIKKSFKDYAIYFFTLILGVCIFYIFNSVDSQTAMLKISSSQGEMIGLLTELLSYVSVFVSFILGFLIIYASRFLIKKRNKEFGVYLTLGMSKRKISFLLLMETFLIGLISLGIGLLLGVVLSQVTSIFIANMFEADMTKFAFNFSKAALIKTIIYFGIIYFIVMIFNTVIINKNKLINLLQASKKQEKIKLKNPIICIILFILSIAMLGSAYYMVATQNGISWLTNHNVSIMALPIILGIFGTVVFFYSVAGMLLKILSKCNNLYAKKLNTFTFKQISSKINTMVISISIICIMLFFTLCLLSSAFTIKNFFNNSLNKYAPCDFGLELYNMPYITSEEVFKKLDLTNDIKNSISINVYKQDNFTYKESLGLYYDTIRKKYPYVQFNSKVEIVSISDYNKLANIYNFENIKLKEDEYIFISNYEKEIYDEVMNLDSTMNVFGKELKPARDNAIEGFIEMGGNPTNMGFIVVPDSIIKKEKYNQVFVGNYKEMTKEQREIIEQKIRKVSSLLPEDSDIECGYSLNTRDDIEESSVGLSAIVTFIGLYLGIIFLISSSAILSLKELSDCLDDKNKYVILRKIGVDEKDINKSLFKQTLIFFMMPLLLAAVHTIFGLRFCSWILSSLGIENLINGSIFTFIFLIGIYGLYFVITYLCNKNLIKRI